MPKTFRYNNIFLYSSLQFSGNIEEYFSAHSKKLVVFLVLPRGSGNNLYRVYEQGKIIEEKKIPVSKNMFSYYVSWYTTQWQLLLKYFTRNDKIILISFHPLAFFFMKLQRLFRNLTFVYWVGDYFPGNDLINIFYRKLSHYYHDKLKYRCYLSDRLNEKMNNGSIIDTSYVKTVMWGIKPYMKKTFRISKDSLTLCFIGVIRESQGIEFLLSVIPHVKQVSLKLLGPAPKHLADKYTKLIMKYGIENRVYFPNKTLYGRELENEIASCHVGIALYDEGKDVGTYYADPAKVKTYAQYGLPILMTDAADIAKYITRFHAGKVIKRDISSALHAISLIKGKYREYIKGLQSFNAYFDYENYYHHKFSFLEKI